MSSSKRAVHSLYQHASQSIAPPNVCRSCRQQLLRTEVLNVNQVRHISQKPLPFTEKVRRKLWGTDNPPGLKDPYGGPSFLERRRQRNLEAHQEEPSSTGGLDADSAPAEDQKTIRQSAGSSPVLQEEYKQAETWDGLQHLGHKGSWRDLPPEPTDEFKPWIQTVPRQARTRAELLSCLYQSIVECLAYRIANKDPNLVCDTQVSHESYPEIFSSKIVLSTSGELSHVDLNGEELQHQRTEEGQAVNVAYYEVPSEDFLTARLDFSDPTTFTILKRFTQLSGLRVSDPVLQKLSDPSSRQSLAYLIDHLTNTLKPKPKNVAETLAQRPQLVGQGNVMVLPRRETPVDKEKEVGRWKIIERELTERGLPVLGRVQSH